MYCEDLPDRIYAVYGKKVTLTFDANGGYFFYNPDITIHQVVNGRGHIFYGETVFHEGTENMSLGWKDQFGNEIPYTSDGVDPYYQIMEDTTFKPIWAKYIIADANEGYFPWDRDKTTLGFWLRTDEPFSNQALLDLGVFGLTDEQMKYFAGWATTPDAEEPDIIDGETDVESLDRIYAVWKDDSYYLEEGDGSSWHVGSTESLSFVVKRTGDDTETFRTFTGIEADGTALSSESFKATDKQDLSLYVTLLPDYLKTLKAGNHTLTIKFQEITVSARFEITAHSYGSDGYCEICRDFIFSDIPASSEKSRQYVSWAYENGIVKGTGAHTFSPDKSCTRGQFVMMLWKMNGSPKVKGVKNPFTDVTGSRMKKAVLWALDKGIIKSAGKFNPKASITRNQTVMILWKLNGWPKVKDVENPFTDVTGNRLKKAVLWAYDEGITKGTSAATFSPRNNCTRMQLVTLLYKMNH